MATYKNQAGFVLGTAGADTYIYTKFFTDWPLLSAGEGTDTLDINIPSTTSLTVRVSDTFNEGNFDGSVAEEPYGRRISFYDMEDVTVTGSSVADYFSLEVGWASSGLELNFDGGAGADTLTLDYSGFNEDTTFTVISGTITSGFGTFSSFEKFEVSAGSGDDYIRTAGGADTVRTGTGVDTVRTGGGNDDVYSESTGGTFDLGAGTSDYWAGDLSANTADMWVLVAATVTASDGTSVANAEFVSLGTGSGDDEFTVNALSRAVLYGGEGADTLIYDVGAPAGQHFNIIAYEGTSGYVFDGDLDNVTFYEFEQLSLRGGDYADTFVVSGPFAADQLSIDGGAGMDTLELDLREFSGGTSFVVNASTGTISANRGQFENLETFWLYGGEGADTFVTGGGNDQLSGGGGSDTINSGAGNDGVSGDAGHDNIAGGAGMDFLYGDAGNDTLDGGVHSDELYGYDGADLLYGRSGSDLLSGGVGIDQMHGGTGSDRYVVDRTGDVITELAGEGRDHVEASVDYTLADHVDDLTLIDSWNINGSGNELANVITGNWGTNQLWGYEGNDELHGGAGNDRLAGGAGADGFYFDTAYTGVDTIIDFVAADDSIYLHRSVFTSVGPAGTLAGGAFRLGTAAADAGDRVIYDKATGKIYYDADGTGSGGKVLFAKVAAGTTLSNADFIAFGSATSWMGRTDGADTTHDWYASREFAEPAQLLDQQQWSQLQRVHPLEWSSVDYFSA